MAQANMAAVPTDWRQTLPENWTVTVRGEDGEEREVSLREHPALAKYASKDEAVKALVHAQKLIGRKPEGWVEVPGEQAGPEDWQNVYAALGRPENPTDYVLPDIDLPEGFEISEQISAQFLEKSHQLGLTPEQVAGLYEWFLPLNVAAAAELEDVALSLKQEELDALRGIHRGDTPKVLDAAKRAVLALGGEELLAALSATGAGDRAAVISAFARMAPLLLEGRLRNRAPVGSQPLTEAKLREMMRDPRYHDPTRRDPDFVRQVTRGFETLFPGQYQSNERG